MEEIKNIYAKMWAHSQFMIMACYFGCKVFLGFVMFEIFFLNQRKQNIPVRLFQESAYFKAI